MEFSPSSSLKHIYRRTIICRFLLS